MDVITNHLDAVMPWLLLGLSELLALAPQLKSNGIVDLVLRLIGYKNQQPVLLTPDQVAQIQAGQAVTGAITTIPAIVKSPTT